ncbi:MAG: response regulator transcription factor [Lewinellaceae bacterium]|nr:response regulator transcription factor [Lewinellaceae bacterium]
MSTIRCLIVDDEELARALLESYVGRMPNLQLVGLCKDPMEALRVLGEEPVDLLFLDIQMPELTGIEFLRSLSQRPLVVFTTAYSEYALEGYELDVADYLLKPISFERFVQAVNKVVDRLRSHSPAQAGKDFLLVKSEHRIHRIRYEDILFVQSMREYVAFYTTEGRILSLGSLKSLEETLPPGQFIRVHKSYIVAAARVSALEGNVIHIGKEKIPIGANYKEEVMRELFK